MGQARTGKGPWDKIQSWHAILTPPHWSLHCSIASLSCLSTFNGPKRIPKRAYVQQFWSPKSSTSLGVFHHAATAPETFQARPPPESVAAPWRVTFDPPSYDARLRAGAVVDAKKTVEKTWPYNACPTHVFFCFLWSFFDKEFVWICGYFVAPARNQVVPQ